jgi:hypothetical protein
VHKVHDRPLAEPTQIAEQEVAFASDIDCECMVCHLPPGIDHSPISWKLNVKFLGNFTTPGTGTMLLCEECFRDWTEHPEDLDVRVVSAHRI